jgi:hypothetical protein
LRGTVFSMSYEIEVSDWNCCSCLTSCYSPRNKRKHSNNDEPSDSMKAMDGIKVVNGLECKISCKTSKVCSVIPVIQPHTILVEAEVPVICHICRSLMSLTQKISCFACGGGGNSRRAGMCRRGLRV